MFYNMLNLWKKWKIINFHFLSTWKNKKKYLHICRLKKKWKFIFP